MILLASASPRRAQLLEQIGVHFEVQPADIDETPLASEQACDYVLRVAKDKASAVLTLANSRWVMGCDTTVVSPDQQLLGKPNNAREAHDMLSALAGREHCVYSGVCLINAQRELQIQACTRVHFAPLTPSQIDDYIATNEPFGKAGAYAIQGMAGAFVTHIEGSYSNVVGLPLAHTADLLAQAGVPIWQRVLT